MNNGPEIVSEETRMTEDGTETDVTIRRHWGVELGNGVVRWDPGYGSGIYVPYDEAEARADLAAVLAGKSGPAVGHYPNARLVTRTETTTVVTTAWEETS